MTGPTSCTKSTSQRFTLNDNGLSGTTDGTGNTQDCTTVPVGTYHVTEGADPAGFALQSLPGNASTRSSGATEVQTPDHANFTIVAGGLVTCTYVNRATAE